MESKKVVLVGCLFSLLVLLFASQMARAPQPQPRICEVRSGRFTSPCLGATNCAQICMIEGFTGGSCDALARCMCQKPCN